MSGKTPLRATDLSSETMTTEREYVLINDKGQLDVLVESHAAPDAPILLWLEV